MFTLKKIGIAFALSLLVCTAAAQATPDSSGPIRAERFLIPKPKPASPDTTLVATGDSPQPLELPPATQDQIAKFTDNAGTLGDSAITETATGNVGIGTTSPAAKLDVRGAIISNSSVGIGEITNPSFTVDLRTNGLGAGMGVQLENSGDAGGDDAQIIFKTHLSRTFSMGLDRSTGMFALTPNSTTLGSAGSVVIDAISGNVGIGTAKPNAKLDVKDTGNTVSLYASNDVILGIGVFGVAVGGGGAGVLGVSQATVGFGVKGTSTTGTGVFGSSVTGEAGHFEGRVIVLGNVGIGTSSPTAKLDVESDSSTNTVYANNTKASGGVGVLGRSTNGIGVFGRSTDGTGVYALSLTGNIMAGFGAGNARKFHINNNGTYTAGSDFAEALPARGGKEGYEPGDVLVVSVKAPGTVEKASQPDDVRLAGVYSTRPGMLGADKQGASRVDKDDVPVAIVGIVPTKVSAMNGAIRVGDMLTTSSTPGYAMRCGNRVRCVGAIVGKALEPLARGKGVIKVLVMLR